MSERYWYYAQDNKPIGPIPEAQLRQLIAQGTIKPETLVYSDILTDWTPASVVESLRTRAAFSPPQTAATPQTDSEIRVKRGVSMSVQFGEKKSPLPPPSKSPAPPAAPQPQPIHLKPNDPSPLPAAEATPPSDISKPKRIPLKAQPPLESPPPPPPHMPPAARPPVVRDAVRPAFREPCGEARTALIFSVLGLICCGFVFGSIAIMKSLEAKRIIAANPNMSGSGMATAALVIGIVDIIGWAIVLAARFVH